MVGAGHMLNDRTMNLERYLTHHEQDRQANRCPKAMGGLAFQWILLRFHLPKGVAPPKSLVKDAMSGRSIGHRSRGMPRSCAIHARLRGRL